MYLTSPLGLVSPWQLVELLFQWMEGLGLSPALLPEWISIWHTGPYHVDHCRLKVQSINCRWCGDIQKEPWCHCYSHGAFPGSTVMRGAWLIVSLDACGSSQLCPWSAVWPWIGPLTLLDPRSSDLKVKASSELLSEALSSSKTQWNFEKIQIWWP